MMGYKDEFDVCLELLDCSILEIIETNANEFLVALESLFIFQKKRGMEKQSIFVFLMLRLASSLSASEFYCVKN